MKYSTLAISFFIFGFFTLILCRAYIKYKTKLLFISNLPNVIGVTGNKYHGKDTISLYICKKYGFKQVAFADPIKEICKILFCFTDDQLHGKSKDISDDRWFGLSPRNVIQHVGTELFRDKMKELSESFKDLFWVLCAKNKILKIREDNPESRIIISDVRFPNEVAMIKDMGGIIIRVKRSSLETEKKDTHSSEILVNNLNVDVDIINDGSLNDLYNKVDDYLDQHVKYKNLINKLKNKKNK